MVPTTLYFLAAAAVGVDTGWQPLDSGGYEYIIQISPEQLESLRNGGEFASDLPSDSGAIRSYKIVVGRGPVVNQGVPLPPEARVALKPAATETPPVQAPPAGDTGPELNGADGTREEKKVTAEKAQTGNRETPPRTPPNWRGAAEQSIDDAKKTLEKASEDEESMLPTPPALSGPRRNKPIGVFGSETDGAEGALRQDDEESPEVSDREAKSSDETTDDAEVEGASAPETESTEPADSSLKFWNTFLTVLTIGLGSLIGWLGFLAWDFRNRYIELLHDLDTQAAPVEEPTERYESAREREVEDDERDEHESRRPSRSDMAYVGRKVQRHRDDDAYEEA
jgi:hypothetical protein